MHLIAAYLVLIIKEERKASGHILLWSLTGQCHEDFAVLGQFWTKIIALRLYS